MAERQARRVMTPRSLLSLVLLGLLSLGTLTIVSAYSSNRVTNGSLFLYTFEEGQLDYSATATSDVLGNNILGDINLNIDACSFLTDRPGLVLPGSSTQQIGFSEKTQAALLDSIEATGVWTMETWFQPGNLDQVSLIFGFGDWDTTTPSTHVQACIRDSLSFELHQDAGNIGGSQLGGTTAKACSKVEVFIEDTSLVHLVLTYTANGTAYVYFNGAYSGASTRVHTWYPYWNSTYRLFISPDMDSYYETTWQGSIFLFAMYNRTLSASDIATNYAAGLPSAKPQPVPLLITLVGYQDTTSQYSVILSATDSDATDGLALYIDIVSLPVNGTVRLNTTTGWTTLTSSSLPWRITTPMTQSVGIEYTPPAGESSEGVEMIGFAGGDAYSLGRVGYLSFTILPVPIPLNVSSTSKIGFATPITLQASNIVNSSTTTLLPHVTALPSLGHVYQTADGVTPLGAALKASALPILVSNSAGIVIFVASDSDLPAGTAADSTNCYGTSSFGFNVQISGGATSQIPGLVLLKVCNRLTATGSNITLVAAAAQTTVNLTGASAISGESIRLVLRSVPAWGRLVILSTDSLASQLPLKVGDSINVTGGIGSIVYRRALDLYDGGWSQTSDAFTFATLLSNKSSTMSSLTASVSINLPLLNSTLKWLDRFNTTISDPQSLAVYTFQDAVDGDASAALGVKDRSTGGLGGTLNFSTSASAGTPTWLSYSAGLTLASSGNQTSPVTSVAAVGLGGLYSALASASGYSVELWLSVSGQTGLIFGIGTGGVAGTLTTAKPCPSGYDISLLQFSDAIAICSGTAHSIAGLSSDYMAPADSTTTTSNVNATAAQTAQIESDQATIEYTRTRVHLVMQYTSGSIYCYLNGVVQMSVGVSSLSTASTAIRQLALGAYGWSGRVYFLSIMSRALSLDEIGRNYAAGPPPSRPVSLPRAQTDTLVEYAGGSVPVVVNSTTELASSLLLPTGPTFYITSLPPQGNGSLVVMRSTSGGVNASRTINSTELPFLFTPSTVSFEYTPPDGLFSGTDATGFSFASCVGRLCSRTSLNGLVHISITSAIAPPLALGSNATGVELKPIRITLAGKDVDLHSPLNSPMTAYWIDALPSGGSVFLSTSSATTPDLTREVLSSALPLRIVASTGVWFIGTAAVAVSSNASSVNAGSLWFRSEVKGTSPAVTSTKIGAHGSVVITLTRHLLAPDASSAFIYSGTRIELPLAGALVSGSGANAIISTTLGVTSLGDSLSKTVTGSSTSLTSTNGCYLLLDDALAFSEKGVVFGLNATWVATNTAAGTTVFLQQWLLSSSTTAKVDDLTATLVSTTSLTISGAGSARAWALASNAWWNVSASDAPFTRFAVCVASGAMPLRVANSTTTPSSSTLRSVVSLPYSSKVDTLYEVPDSDSRQTLVIDASLLVWNGVDLDDLSTTPSSWPTVNKALTTSQLSALTQPTRVWEKMSLVLTRRTVSGGILVDRNVATSDAVELCAAPASLPCALPNEVDYLFVSTGLTKAARLVPDSFGFAVRSNVTLNGLANVLGSDGTVLAFNSVSGTFTITKTAPLATPTFDPSLQVITDATTVSAYSSDAFEFGMHLNSTNSGASELSYLTTMSILPITGGFNLPVADESAYSSSVTFSSGGSSSNTACVFTVSSLASLNALLGDMTFQPLYAVTYNLTVSVIVINNTNGDTASPVVGNVLWIVTDSDATSTSSASGSGLLSFLTAKGMIYLWIALGVCACICIGFGGRKRYLAWRRGQDKKLRKAARAARKAENASSANDLLAVMRHFRSASAGSFNEADLDADEEEDNESQIEGGERKRTARSSRSRRTRSAPSSRHSSRNSSRNSSQPTTPRGGREGAPLEQEEEYVEDEEDEYGHTYSEAFAAEAYEEHTLCSSPKLIMPPLRLGSSIMHSNSSSPGRPPRVTEFRINPRTPSSGPQSARSYSDSPSPSDTPTVNSARTLSSIFIEQSPEQLEEGLEWPASPSFEDGDKTYQDLLEEEPSAERRPHEWCWYGEELAGDDDDEDLSDYEYGEEDAGSEKSDDSNSQAQSDSDSNSQPQSDSEDEQMEEQHSDDSLSDHDRDHHHGKHGLEPSTSDDDDDQEDEDLPYDENGEIDYAALEPRAGDDEDDDDIEGGEYPYELDYDGDSAEYDSSDSEIPCYYSDSEDHSYVNDQEGVPSPRPPNLMLSALVLAMTRAHELQQQQQMRELAPHDRSDSE